MAALLWRELIFDVDSGYARVFIFVDSTNHGDRVAIPGVRVGDHRHRDCAGNAAGVVDHLGHTQQADIWATKQTRRAPKTCHVDGRKAGRLDQSRTQRIVSPGRQDRFGTRQ